MLSSVFFSTIYLSTGRPTRSPRRHTYDADGAVTVGPRVTGAPIGPPAVPRFLPDSVAPPVRGPVRRGSRARRTRRGRPPVHGAATGRPPTGPRPRHGRAAAKTAGNAAAAPDQLAAALRTAERPFGRGPAPRDDRPTGRGKARVAHGLSFPGPRIPLRRGGTLPPKNSPGRHCSAG